MKPEDIPEGFCLFRGKLIPASELPDSVLDLPAFTHDGVPCGTIRDCVTAAPPTYSETMLRYPLEKGVFTLGSVLI